MSGGAAAWLHVVAIDGAAPNAFRERRSSEAICDGRGLIEPTVDAYLAGLRLFGRLAASTVILALQTLLIVLLRRGRALSKVAVARTEPVARVRGRRLLTPVTQWSLAQ